MLWGKIILGQSVPRDVVTRFGPNGKCVQYLALSLGAHTLSVEPHGTLFQKNFIWKQKEKVK